MTQMLGWGCWSHSRAAGKGDVGSDIRYRGLRFDVRLTEAQKIALSVMAFDLCNLSLELLANAISSRSTAVPCRA